MAPIYNATKKSNSGAEEHYERTKARIEKIQSHFANGARGTRMQDKVCIITGVGSLKGIGRATALLYAHEGAKHLYLLDFSPENLPNLKSTIEKAYPDVKVTVIEADAANETAIEGICKQALKEEGKLDVFFANAGVATAQPLETTTAESYMNTMRINGLSVFLAIKHASAAMKVTNASVGKVYSGGSIIVTASVAGIRSGAGTVDYSASKAAVNSMAMTSAFQLQKTDIRVNSICPGLIETGMTGATFDYARSRGATGKVGQLNPLGRYGVAEEIAQAALFLGSDDSSYINGQALAVDGGLSASHPVVPGRWA